MGREIERKFLIADGYMPDVSRMKSYDIEQGYIAEADKAIVRIRTRDLNGFVTIKCNEVDGETGVDEYEYEIPFRDAQQLLKLSAGTIKKKRYLIPFAGHTFELDVFEDKLRGLKVVEIELESADEEFLRPAWVGEEVTEDKRYSNKNLLKNGKP